ncbi:MAG: N-succinylarginine dihydrolase [Pirellulales bacterium]
MPPDPPAIAIEVNFDGLVGPTHHYGGLGLGNLASQRHRHELSDPRAAALEGLTKMRLLHDLGVPQGVLPPQERPLVSALRRIGFAGNDAAVLAAAASEAPEFLAAAASTSSMWAANAATVSPAADTANGRVHLTPANLVSQFHRGLEPPATTAMLRRIFAATSRFVVHDPLPAALPFADEGAANHVRLTPAHGKPGLEIFVYGRAEGEPPGGGRFVPRQSLAASRAVARLHGLDPTRTLFLRQSNAAIDSGAFHNDVIAVGNENVFIVHEQAYADGPAAIAAIRDRYAAACGDERALAVIEVPAAEVPLEVAVSTYLFNSQLVTLPGGGMAMICPAECREHPATSRWLDRLVAGDTPVVAVYPVAVRQSMRNGGGPACLRLRVVLTREELAAVHQGMLVTPALLDALVGWVKRHYRDRLTLADLADPALLAESRDALAELHLLFGLSGISPT